jgi:hypothetical protein
MRALALVLLFVAAGCGDDTTTSQPPDLSFPCSGTNVTDCCHRSVGSSNPPQPCSVIGDSCTGFELLCTCTADRVWACHGPLFYDLAIPVFGD